ncbi:MAG: 30S ribosomal protein S7 [Hadesarchaea archaeon CG08_land_8_20_14_0_20_51_8]|nr:MAG: 30S ribosomal protein S7 [Hadesarchaea archaeon CG08_land_8_20_14_0_20_51_8]
MLAFKYFGKWGAEGVSVADPGLQKYIRLEPLSTVLHSGGKHAKKQFGKAELTIVERLMNKLMRSGPGARKLGGKVIRGAGACGKKHKAYNIVRRSFDIIEQKAKKNPLQVLINAVQNSAPREETTRISYGGITYHLAVDSAPQRRLDIALKNIAGGAFAASFRNKKTIQECLADELIMASNNDMKSFAIARKEETERIAKGAR